MVDRQGRIAVNSSSVSTEFVLLPEDRCLKIQDSEILDIAEVASSDWKKIARRLPNAANPAEPAFKLGDQRLRTIQREACDNEEECLIGVLQRWRVMNAMHTRGLLWDTLCKCGFGEVAVNVFPGSIPVQVHAPDKQRHTVAEQALAQAEKKETEIRAKATENTDCKVDWSGLLNNVCDGFITPGMCDKLQKQLPLLGNPIQRLKSSGYGGDWPAIASQLFDIWLSDPETEKLDDKERRDKLAYIFSDRMNCEDLTRKMDRLLEKGTYLIGS